MKKTISILSAVLIAALLFVLPVTAFAAETVSMLAVAARIAVIRSEPKQRVFFHPFLKDTTHQLAEIFVAQRYLFRI